MADANPIKPATQSHQLISRNEAIAAGLTRYFTGEPCKYGHISPKVVSGFKCVECALSRQNKKRAKERALKYPEGRKPWKKCGPGMKVCSLCRVAKKETQFSPDNRAADGLQPRCLDCCRIKNNTRYHDDIEASRKQRRDYYAKNTDRIRENSARSREKNREQLLEGKKYYYERVKNEDWYIEQSRAYREATKEQKREYDKAYCAENRERKNEMALRWARANPETRRAICFAYDARRRAATKNGATGPEVKDWSSRQQKICYWCGAKCTKDFHIDHYVPLSRGGPHEIDNLVIACPPCNLRKNAKDPYKFAESVGRLF